MVKTHRVVEQAMQGAKLQKVKVAQIPTAKEECLVLLSRVARLKLILHIIQQENLSISPSRAAQHLWM